MSVRFRMAGEVRGQVRLDADRAHAGTAAAMRDAEGLVQVEVADVGTDVAGAGKADHGVHVGAVQVDLAAVLVHDLADLTHVLLEHAMGRRIGDHAAREVFRVLLGFRTEIVHVDVAVFTHLDDDDLHAGHLRGGRVGAVRRGRDQADVAMAVAVGDVIGADRQQTGILTLRARVRLHRDRVVAGDGAELFRQVLDHVLVASRLLLRHEGMDLGEFRPGDRQHFRGRVELHRARAERNHRPVEREVAVRQTADVARHLAFCAVHVEDRVHQVLACAQQRLRQAVTRLELFHLEVAAEGAPDGFERDRARALVKADADLGLADLAQVHFLGDRGLEDDALQLADFDGDRVEEHIGLYGIAEFFKAHGETHGLLVNALGDRLDALRSMEHRVHRGHDGEQHLGGADVRRRFLAADVLFAGLQRQAIGAVAARIDRYADEAAGHGALVRVLDRHIGRMRTAIADRHAEALGAADSDIGAHLSGRLQQSQRQRIGGDGCDRAGLVQAGDQAGEIVHVAVGARILEDRAENIDRIEIGEGIADDDLPAERLGAGLQESDRLRVAVLVDEEGLGLRLRDALGHRHGFSCGGRFVEQRGVGDVEAGQVADHGLVVEQRLEAALADFRLVGRIGRVPGRVFQDVALDHRRRDRAIIALADQRHELLVAVGRFAHLVERLALGHRRGPGERRLLADRRWHGIVDERVE
ncbi:hypothetical protein D9M68_519800 [compost metagenome]